VPYPEGARGSAVVVLELLIEVDGSVSEVVVVEGAEPFAELARSAARDWHAMAAFNAGHNREAAARFASFVAEHAGDPRAEDAAYLRVLALQRAGDEAGMRATGHEYLQRYRRGFRRAEVQALVR
jgi:hypothetical protein